MISLVVGQSTIVRFCSYWMTKMPVLFFGAFKKWRENAKHKKTCKKYHHHNPNFFSNLFLYRDRNILSGFHSKYWHSFSSKEQENEYFPLPPFIFPISETPYKDSISGSKRRMSLSLLLNPMKKRKSDEGNFLKIEQPIILTF